MDETMEIQKIEEQQKSVFDPQAFNHMILMADKFSNSKLVPVQFQDAPDDCLIAIQYAAELRINPLQFMQNSYIVHGKAGIESKLAIALANNSDLFEGGIEYRMEGEGDGMSCTAFAKLKVSGNIIESNVSIKTAKAEGWTTKAGSKWKTIPELMLKYRSAMFLIRTHCPQVIIGLQSKEELVDTYGDRKVKDITPELERINLLEVKKPEAHPVKVDEGYIIEPTIEEKVLFFEKNLEKIFLKLIPEEFKLTGLSVKDVIENYFSKQYNSFEESDIKELKEIYSIITNENKSGKKDSIVSFLNKSISNFTE